MVDQSVLFARWNDLADWLFALMKDGHEGAVLEHLARQPEAAEPLVRAAFASDDYTHPNRSPKRPAACW